MDFFQRFIFSGNGGGVVRLRATDKDSQLMLLGSWSVNVQKFFYQNRDRLSNLPSILPGAAIFFEFKHYKPKKRFTSTKCFAFMEMDEIKPGPIVIELWVDWRVSFCPNVFLEGLPCHLLKHAYTHCLLEIQVQEAHGLQEEETAASNKETTLSPPSSDIAQGQLSRCTPWTSFNPPPYIHVQQNVVFHLIASSNTKSRLWSFFSPMNIWRK